MSGGASCGQREWVSEREPEHNWFSKDWSWKSAERESERGWQIQNEGGQSAREGGRSGLVSGGAVRQSQHLGLEQTHERLSIWRSWKDYDACVENLQ